MSDSLARFPSLLLCLLWYCTLYFAVDIVGGFSVTISSSVCRDFQVGLLVLVSYCRVHLVVSFVLGVVEDLFPSVSPFLIPGSFTPSVVGRLPLVFRYC